VVIRNASGQVLRLRRREKSEKNPLHEKIVVWAGGHVRNEDNRTGQAILTCITRELEEELRLRVNSDNITLLGAIYIENNKSSSKHVAIVYEWKAPTDDVEVALSNAEFFERRGTSLSGKFVDLDEILKDMNIGKNEEEWSGYIIREFVAKDSKFIQRPLF
jgi:predicted NUDIX family phosphoesterase